MMPRPQSDWSRFASALAACLTIATTAIAETTAEEPVVVRPAPANESRLIVLPSGHIKCFYTVMGGRDRIESIESTDNGLTWSAPVVEIPLPGLKTHHACQILLDRHGELHAWFVAFANRDQEPHRPKMALDVWHCRTSQGKWGEPQRVFVGYVGALRGAVQMTSGRIVVPFGVWNDSEPTPRRGPPGTGNHFVTTIYSDDDGKTWNRSAAMLTAPVFENYNGNNYGACEPTLVELEDKRLWMLMRTQTGYLYESFSSDGAKWTPATASRFASSNSPAAVARLRNGCLIVLWNNAQMPKRIGKQMLYAGRDTLHAAMSADNGDTWHGFREVYRDPTRHETPPPRGDRGTAYPSIVQAPSGELVVATGQGEKNRGILRFNAEWLSAQSASDDFKDGLRNWTAFKEFGKPYSIFLDRKLGPEIVTVDSDDVEHAMRLRRPNEAEATDTAIWNFPASRDGRLQLKVKCPAESQGLAIALADRFFNPADPAGSAESMFRFRLKPPHRTDDNRWHTLEFSWSVEAARCLVRLDGTQIAELPLQHNTKNGISYLRLASAATEADSNGVLVAEVHATIENESLGNSASHRTPVEIAP